MSQAVVDYYTDIADSYEEAIFRDNDYVAYEKVPQWIVDHLHSENSLILDLGCGTGLSALKFFESGCSVTGVDITPKMVEQCRRLPFNQLYCQSLEEPFPPFENLFDAAVMIGVMEFIHDIPALFSRVASSLKSKGLFGLTIPMKLSYELEDKLQIRTYTPAEIEKLLLAAGFSILYEEEFQGFVYLEETVHYCGFLVEKR